MLLYPVVQIIVPDGTVLEGHGVIPDIRVELDRELLLQEIDSQLEAAIEYLRQDVPQGCFERDQPSAKERV